MILECLYFMMPAYFANMAPVIFKRFKFLGYPVDFNKKLGNKPVLGKNKTYRGIFFGVLAALVIAYLQFYLYQYPFFRSISFYNYNNWAIIGFLLGFGALLGDLVKSFIKRRMNVKPGKRFIPLDQIDYSIGAIALFSFYDALSSSKILIIIIMSFFLHIITNHSAFYLKIRDEKW